MRAKLVLAIMCFSAFIILSGITVFAASNFSVAAQSSFQTWQMSVTSSSGTHSGTLSVDSDGSFTSSGFSGSTSEGSYPINIEGYMSGSSMTFTETASYDGGQGEIYATCSDGSLDASFPSATYAYGTMDGTITDPLGSRSFSMSWTATKTSGNGGNDNTYPTDNNGIIPSLDLGWVIPYVVATIVGTVLVAVIGVVAWHNSSARKTQQAIRSQQLNSPQVYWREQHPMNPQYGSPYPPNSQSPAGFQGGLEPQPITMDNGIPITGAGASVGSQEIGDLPFLNGFWEPSLARLSWGTPQFDSSKYRLLGYDISQQTYGPTSTTTQSVYLTRVPAGTNALNQPFNQTFRWNTSGDIAGYRVDPVYGQINPSGQVGSQFRFGGLGIRMYEPIGTFGIGP